MVKDFFELDGDGVWLPENWRSLDVYTKKNGKFKPRNRIYGCKWKHGDSEVEIVNKYPVSFTVSKDRSLVVAIESDGKSKNKIRIFSSEGHDLGRILVPVYSGECRELPCFYSIDVPGQNDQWEIRYNDGHDDYIADTSLDLTIKNSRKFRW